ncbi:hypothetical protein BV25DRAFT_767880 [Artomyces pyxidatus]|uniref:Uncharacterized protein n=1 Tax=Artomyces pyxidatus TaxID=48021 RepID=A0ACB8T0B0_9AGAM|nr:hypothetical protein BV25DRAFT_767880 [Artomyces pyxidatus]
MQSSCSPAACSTARVGRTPYDRLDRLRRYTAAREQRRWTSRIALPHLIGCKPPCALSDDTFVLPHTEHSKVTVSASVQRLPSDLHAIDERHVIPLVPISTHILDFKPSSTQDPLVFLEFQRDLVHRVHLRSLSTGEPHSLACMLGVMKSPGPVAILQDVCGDYLFETVKGDRLTVIRNWKTGRVEVRPRSLSFIVMMAHASAYSRPMGYLSIVWVRSF